MSMANLSDCKALQECFDTIPQLEHSDQMEYE